MSRKCTNIVVQYYLESIVNLLYYSYVKKGLKEYF